MLFCFVELLLSFVCDSLLFLFSEPSLFLFFDLSLSFLVLFLLFLLGDSLLNIFVELSLSYLVELSQLFFFVFALSFFVKSSLCVFRRFHSVVWALVRVTVVFEATAVKRVATMRTATHVSISRKSCVDVFRLFGVAFWNLIRNRLSLYRIATRAAEIIKGLAKVGSKFRFPNPFCASYFRW